MSNLLAIAGRGSMPGLATVALTLVGLSLNQLTSLELGPRGRDFQVNLNLDVPAVQDVSQPLEKADAVLGQMMVVLHVKSAPARGPRTSSNVGAPAAHARPAVATILQALPLRPAPGQTLPSIPVSTQVSPAKPSSTRTSPEPPVAPAPAASSAPHSPPIIGRCQNSLTGLSSETSPSSEWPDPADNSCLEAGGRD
jgi:hypothetical protein